MSSDNTKKKKATDVFICSKLASDQAYTTYLKGQNQQDIPRKDKQVLINGGTGVASKHLITPQGVVTCISSDQLEMLEANCEPFNDHVRLGFLKVLDYNPTPEVIAKVAADLAKDKSEQKTPADLKKKKTKQE
jgi:hypothetical protein